MIGRKFALLAMMNNKDTDMDSVITTFNSSIADWFWTTVWVWQGCLLSPTLFNVFLERIMTDAVEDHEGTCSIGGRAITNLPFSHDIDDLAGEDDVPVPCIMITYTVQLIPLTSVVIRGHERRFSRDPLPVFSVGGHRERFWHGQSCPLFDVVHPALPLLITALPTLQGALKDGFTMPVYCSWQLPEGVPVDPQGSWSCFTPSCWSCAPRRRYREVSSCTWFQKPGSFFRVSMQGSCFTAVEEDGGDKRLVEL